MAGDERQPDSTEILIHLEKVEGKIDLLIQAGEQHAINCDADRAALRHDVRTIEKKQSWMLGIGSAIVLAIGAISAMYKGTIGGS